MKIILVNIVIFGSLFLIGYLSFPKRENPYKPGTGHYVGYEWAKSRGIYDCGDDSDSFTEGCKQWVFQNQRINSMLEGLGR